MSRALAIRQSEGLKACCFLARSFSKNEQFVSAQCVGRMSGFLKITADLKTESLKHSRPQNSYIRNNRDWRKEMVKHGFARQLFFNRIFAIPNTSKDIW